MNPLKIRATKVVFPFKFGRRVPTNPLTKNLCLIYQHMHYCRDLEYKLTELVAFLLLNACCPGHWFSIYNMFMD